MKKPVINPSERDCPECMGTGFVMVKHLRVPESGFIKSARNALVRAGLPIGIAKSQHAVESWSRWNAMRAIGSVRLAEPAYANSLLARVVNFVSRALPEDSARRVGSNSPPRSDLLSELRRGPVINSVHSFYGSFVHHPLGGGRTRSVEVRGRVEIFAA